MQEHPREYKIGVDVYSSDDKKLGELYRLVVRRSDLTITHLVVDIGFLRSGRPIWAGGFGLEYDRVVPVSSVSAVTDERLDLAVTSQVFFEETPEYSAEFFEPPEDLSPNALETDDLAADANALSAIISNTPSGWLVEKRNRPLDSVDIKEGTDVWRRDPHEKLGDVKRVLLNDAGRLTAFVIRRGFLFTRDVVLPARYVAELYDEIVRVDIPTDVLENLAEYEDDD
jgi:hypothetical protein